MVEIDYEDRKSFNVIYLDNAATTPCDPLVVQAMQPFWETYYGNASSTHAFGRRANNHLEEARSRLLNVLAQGIGSIVFTSGATESNNIAVLSCVRYTQALPGKSRILYLGIEHKSIIEPLQYWGAALGVIIEKVSVDDEGRLDEADFDAKLRPDVGAVICQMANSETGVIQDIGTVAARSRSIGALCFSDVTQAIGKIHVDFGALKMDMATFNAHKIHGPKGIGALWTKPGVRLVSANLGGGQERGVRPGTEPLPLVVGLATAVEIAVSNQRQFGERVRQLRDMFWNGLVHMGGATWNGKGAHLMPTHLNIRLDNVLAQDLMLRAQGVAFSSGSACNVRAQQPSPVLQNMGLDLNEVESSMRFSFGRQNTRQEVESALDQLGRAVFLIRRGN